MFHSGRALLYSKGYREKSHSALLEALTALFVRTGLLERDYIDDLRDAKSMRDSADYGMIFSEDRRKDTDYQRRQVLEESG